MRRFVQGLVSVVIVLLFGFHAAGGWYFSGQIDADGLEVRQRSEQMTLRVESVAGDVIGLKETGGDDEAVDDDSTYGLAWSTGFGQIFGPVVTDGETVARHLRVLEGSAPTVGQGARLERDAFHDPSVALKKQTQDVRYTSSGGTFTSWFVPGSDDTWAIFTHGFGGTTRTEMLRPMAVTVALGMPSLAISYRNDADAPQDASGRYGYGASEWPDLEGAVRYALDHGANDVVLMGSSMGGAVTAAFLEHSSLASRVRRVVLDAPMLDFGATVSYAAAHRTLPVIGTIPESLTWTAKQIASLRYGVDWGAIDYLDDTSWLKVPTLVFHGADDGRVPVQTSRDFASAHPDVVRLVVVEKADHVESWNWGPAAYDSELRDFLTVLTSG